MTNDRINFTDLLAENLIIDNLPAKTKEEALSEMAAYLVDKGFCKPSFIQAILDREAKHPSALPMKNIKIAIPHTDSTHVKKPAILFARLSEPVEFRSMGNPDQTLKVPLISMLALKDKKRIGDLLETLITVYQDSELLEKLCESSSKKEIYAILRDRVSKYEKTC